MADNGEKKPSGFGGFFEGLERKDLSFGLTLSRQKKKLLAEKCKKKGNTIKVTDLENNCHTDQA